MNEGEWKTNMFADPDVRKHIMTLRDENIDLQTELKLTRRYIKWVEATYPNMRAEYQAIRDLEEASRERSPFGFAQAQTKAEGSYVSYE
jgi:hypothetical protein